MCHCCLSLYPLLLPMILDRGKRRDTSTSKNSWRALAWSQKKLHQIREGEHRLKQLKQPHFAFVLLSATVVNTFPSDSWPLVPSLSFHYRFIWPSPSLQSFPAPSSLCSHYALLSSKWNWQGEWAWHSLATGSGLERNPRRQRNERENERYALLSLLDVSLS